MRITQFLIDEHVPFETWQHPPAYTAQKLARFVHVSGHCVAKSVLLKGRSGYVVAVLPASFRIDLNKVGQTLGHEIRVAEEKEIAEFFRDCEWGLVVPFGRLYGLPTILDAAFQPDQFMLFEAQSHGLSIKMRCQDFQRLENPRQFQFAKPIQN